ncbi:hypothetical protein [Streptomyces canus]|uniref:hypothetical protein n=1 Tax=Streptomyces canus TaxID=58343 RepID=UPI000783A6BC|nr:hypothetical protein [Streptomyces canus]
MRLVIRASALTAACCLKCADTVGVGGRGTAQITPHAVVHVDKAGAETLERGPAVAVDVDGGATLLGGGDIERNIAFRWKIP